MQIFSKTNTVLFRIVYYGPAMCGKTTNLMQSYNRLQAEQRLSPIQEIPTESDKTLKYECSHISSGGNIGKYKAEFEVYTVPGQIYYDATRKIILKNADAVVFVADSQKSKRDENIQLFREMKKHLLEQNLKLYENVPLVLQFNKQDLPDSMPLEMMTYDLQENDTPCFAAAAITGDGVMETFNMIVNMTTAKAKERNKSIKV